jgi:hypothetical protein
LYEASVDDCLIVELKAVQKVLPPFLFRPGSDPESPPQIALGLRLHNSVMVDFRDICICSGRNI